MAPPRSEGRVDRGRTGAGRTLWATGPTPAGDRRPPQPPQLPPPAVWPRAGPAPSLMAVPRPVSPPLMDTLTDPSPSCRNSCRKVSMWRRSRSAVSGRMASIVTRSPPSAFSMLSRSCPSSSGARRSSAPPLMQAGAAPQSAGQSLGPSRLVGWGSGRPVPHRASGPDEGSARPNGSCSRSAASDSRPGAASSRSAATPARTEPSCPNGSGLPRLRTAVRPGPRGGHRRRGAAGFSGSGRLGDGPPTRDWAADSAAGC
jgi:hypothetical protein